MSQRECAGFNWPPLSIPAEEPVSICPPAVNRAGWLPINVNACSLNGLPRGCSSRPAKNSGVADALFQSLADGVAQLLACQDTTSTVLRLESLFPAALLPFCAGVPAIGVDRPAIAAIWFSGRPVSQGLASFAPLFASAAVTVGHPKQPVSDVRRTDARRRKRDGPEGVIHGFQVSVYKVDPRVDSLASNLLSKDD